MIKKPMVSIFLCLTLGACGTEVGNPGDKKEPTGTAPDKPNAPQESVSAPVKIKAPPEPIVVREGTIVVSPNADSANPPTANPPSSTPVEVTFNPSTLTACATDSPSLESTSVSALNYIFSIGTSTTATDVKFFLYNSADVSKYVEKNPLIPSEAGTYRIYALSYMLKAGCYIDVVVNPEQLTLAKQFKITLTRF